MGDRNFRRIELYRGRCPGQKRKGRARGGILLAAALILGAVLLRVPACGESLQEIQQGIAGEVLRFHVLANSDGQEDQQLKLQVKDVLVEKLSGLLADCATVEESVALVEDNLEQIRQWAEAEIRQRGYDYPVQARVCDAWFPEKSYGDCTFPEGTYRALQVRIGEARGKNWWCLLFPGLCFAGTLEGQVPEESKDKLREVLTPQEYRAVTGHDRLSFGFRWF